MSLGEIILVIFFAVCLIFLAYIAKMHRDMLIAQHNLEKAFNQYIIEVSKWLSGKKK